MATKVKENSQCDEAISSAFPFQLSDPKSSSVVLKYPLSHTLDFTPVTSHVHTTSGPAHSWNWTPCLQPCSSALSFSLFSFVCSLYLLFFLVEIIFLTLLFYLLMYCSVGYQTQSPPTHCTRQVLYHSTLSAAHFLIFLINM